MLSASLTRKTEPTTRGQQRLTMTGTAGRMTRGSGEKRGLEREGAGVKNVEGMEAATGFIE